MKKVFNLKFRKFLFLFFFDDLFILICNFSMIKYDIFQSFLKLNDDYLFSVNTILKLNYI